MFIIFQQQCYGVFCGNIYISFNKRVCSYLEIFMQCKQTGVQSGYVYMLFTMDINFILILIIKDKLMNGDLL